MELTITISREEYLHILRALCNAEIDAWEHQRKAYHQGDQDEQRERREDEELLFSLRNRIEQAADLVAPWEAEVIG